MGELAQQTNQKKGLLALYYLMVHADGNMSEQELKMGEVMCEHEMIDISEFKKTLEENKKETKENIYKRCMEELKSCDHQFNVKCVAWMSIIANSDGFMSSEEWKLLYRVYANELFLDLKDILEFQKSLPRN